MNFIRISLSSVIAFVMIMGLFSLNGITTAVADVDATNNGNSIMVETDSLTIDVKGGGNLPMFFFWDNEDVDNTYKVQLSSLFETEDNNGNGVYDLGEDKKVPTAGTALASLSWDFSEFDVETTNDVTTAIHFNISSNPGNKNKDIDVSFNVHVNSDNAKSLKFDVILGNYTFVDDAAMLVLAFKLIVSDGSDASQSGDEISFGDGFFQSEDTAQDENGDINVGLSTGSEDSKMIYLAYEHFEGKLVHDPTVGVQAASLSATTDDEGNTSDQNSEVKTTTVNELAGLSRGETFSSSIVATLVFLSVTITIYRSKKH